MNEVENSGAQFVRADLHIHSFKEGGSFDVEDATMTPEAIVDLAIQKDLKIISITDHNVIENSIQAVNYAADKNILVIPGIEVGTTQGHLLLYFDTIENLKKFHSKLTVSIDKQRCDEGIVQCLDYASQFNGIGILAHIELPSGFESTIGKFGPHFEDVICHPNLYALEISTKDSVKRYTRDDENIDRLRMKNLRIERSKLDADFEFCKVMSSDAHKLDKLGKNADDENKLTRIKVDTLNFQAFKNALINQSSRIRLEDFIPERTPRFVRIEIEGGLLDKQIVNFSKNLTCIIGGRGTGKSTLLESLREASGNKSKSKIVDCDVWPENINVVYEDESGQEIKLFREKNSSVVNSIDPITGITTIPIESYGQGETADTIQHSDSDPSILLNFLDSFISLSTLKLEEDETRNKLIQNQSEIRRLRIDVSTIADTVKEKKNLEKKIEHLKKEEVGDLVKHQTALMNERALRKNIIAEIKELIDNYRSILSDKSIFESFEDYDEEDMVVGQENFIKVKKVLDAFSKIVENKESELNEALNAKVIELKEQIKDWSGKEKLILSEIDEKKKELESKGIPFDIGKINQLSQELIHFTERLKKLEQKKTELDGLNTERKKLLGERRILKNRIYTKRLGFAEEVNKNLKNSVDGFFVTVKFQQGLFSPQFEEGIKSAMDWRTAQVPKAKILSENLSPIEFAESVKRKNLDKLKDIVDEDGERVFSDKEIEKIIQKIRENLNYEDFESINYEDSPSIIVTKGIINEKGEKKYVSRSLAQLSLGQQQSILLAILLQSKSRVPLIIDQPEDNLDSEFIYKTIVSNLKKIKERRQVIVVTHNPNIAVLGDAELIVPLKSTNVKSSITKRGSIDRPETRKLCCEILEGGEIAFKKRKEIYGF